MDTSFFLKSGDVKDRLEVNQRGLQTISPYILHLYASQRKTCLWPEKYINALLEFLHDNEDPPDVNSVWNFARLRGTRQLIRAIQSSFEQQLDSKTRYTVDEAAQLLGVGGGTIRDWQHSGVLVPTSEVVRVRQGRGEGRIAVVHVMAQEIRKAFEWKLPTV